MTQPGEIVKIIPLTVGCPKCLAQPGEPCTIWGFTTVPHSARVRMAQAAVIMRSIAEADDAALRSNPMWSLRNLAKQVEDLARTHPAYSQAHGAIQNCCDHLCAIARCEEANKEIKKLRSQLPEKMQHCTVLFKKCEKGHGRLTATNWIDHGCQQCKIDDLLEDLKNHGHHDSDCMGGDGTHCLCGYLDIYTKYFGAPRLMEAERSLRKQDT